MDASQRLSCSLLLSLAGVACVQAQSGRTVPTVETILTRMAQARTENRTRLRPYQVTRTYRLFSKEEQTTKSEVIVDVTFVPPNIKQYAIRQATGMGLGVLALLLGFTMSMAVTRFEVRKQDRPPRQHRWLPYRPGSARGSGFCNLLRAFRS